MHAAGIWDVYCVVGERCKDDCFTNFPAVGPVPEPRLDIIQAGGQPIPEDTTGAVQVVLASGSPTAQTTRIQARNFTGCVPINVVTPETPDSRAGDRVFYPAQIDMNTNPDSLDVPVTLPVNVVTFIDVWTRAAPCS